MTRAHLPLGKDPSTVVVSQASDELCLEPLQRIGDLVVNAGAEERTDFLEYPARLFGQHLDAQLRRRIYFAPAAAHVSVEQADDLARIDRGVLVRPPKIKEVTTLIALAEGAQLRGQEFVDRVRWNPNRSLNDAVVDLEESVHDTCKVLMRIDFDLELPRETGLALEAEEQLGNLTGGDASLAKPGQPLSDSVECRTDALGTALDQIDVL